MKGYYSLVQYCPDVARLEAANVGVVLLCPEVGFLDVKLIAGNARVRKFFGEEADDYRHLNQMKTALSERLKVDRTGLLSLDALGHFIGAWANKVTLTVPKPVKVFSPADDLLALYKELVEEPVRDLSVRAAMPLRKRLDAALGAAPLANLVRKNIEVQVPALKRPMEAPYGYQNGRFNLIVPGEFMQKSDVRIENAACKLAVEGRSLYEHRDPNLGDLQLVVVTDFSPGHEKARLTVTDIFNEYHVRVFAAENLSALRNEIIAQGKPQLLI